MDPSLANQDFDPPPQPGWGRWILPAVAVHLPLAAALALGVEWKQRPQSEKAQAGPEPQRVAAAPGPAAMAAAPQTRCPLRPLLGTAGGNDGQLLPPADLAGKSVNDIPALLQVGKEAAAAGQRRDAEVAFLTSCRIADALKGPGSVESADARYQLGRHYAAVLAASEGTAPEAERQQLRRQAEALYADSWQAYRSKLGGAHEKSVFAAEGLESLRQKATQVVGASASPPPAPAAAPPQAPAQVATARAAPAPQARPRPSFDCAKARSAPEKLICADPELAQLDRDLGRLHRRAKTAATDPAAFRRQNDSEWRRREAKCRDRECLLQWYTHRRQQLLVTLDEAGQDTGTASR